MNSTTPPKALVLSGVDKEQLQREFARGVDKPNPVKYRDLFTTEEEIQTLQNLLSSGCTNSTVEIGQTYGWVTVSWLDKAGLKLEEFLAIPEWQIVHLFRDKSRALDFDKMVNWILR